MAERVEHDLDLAIGFGRAEQLWPHLVDKQRPVAVVQPDVDRAVGPDLRVDLHQPGQLLKQPVAVVLKPRVLRGAVGRAAQAGIEAGKRSEEHTSELQSLMRISYAVF